MNPSLAPNLLFRKRASPSVAIVAAAATVFTLFEVESRDGCNESRIQPVVIDTKSTNIFVVINYKIDSVMQTLCNSI